LSLDWAYTGALNENGEQLESVSVAYSLLSGGEGGEEHSVDDIVKSLLSFPLWARKALLKGKLLDEAVHERIAQLVKEMSAEQCRSRRQDGQHTKSS